MAYVNPNIHQIDFDNLTGWDDGDINGAVSSISPAGQMYSDCRAMSSDGYTGRIKEVGAVGSGNYYLEMRFKGDVWDGSGGDSGWGMRNLLEADTKTILFTIGNGQGTGDGLYVYSSGYNYVHTKTWDNDWHIITFYMHDSQALCDIWIDKDPRSEAADETDVACNYDLNQADGKYNLNDRGTVAGNGEYHRDYIYVGSELLSTTYTSPLPAFRRQ